MEASTADPAVQSEAPEAPAPVEPEATPEPDIPQAELGSIELVTGKTRNLRDIAPVVAALRWNAEEVASKRKLYVTVTNDDGETVYQTWNSDEGYKTVTLYLDETDPPLTDARADVQGAVIGKSVWNLDPVALRRERDTRVLRVEPGDVVVFETDEVISADQTAAIKALLSEILDQAGHEGIPTAVVSGGKLLVHPAPGEPPLAPATDPEVRG